MNQHGAALLLGLVLLAALSLLTAMAANGMWMQRRVAANFYSSQQALQHAAVAEAEARAWLDSRADSERERDCLADCLLPIAIHQAGELPPDPQLQGRAWWQSEAVRTGTHPETGDPLNSSTGGDRPAFWLLGELHYETAAEAATEPGVAGVGYYRLLARGEGLQAGSVVVTESIVARPWEGDFDPGAFPVPRSPGDFCGQFAPDIDCGVLAWRQLR